MSWDSASAGSYQAGDDLYNDGGPYADAYEGGDGWYEPPAYNYNDGEYPAPDAAYDPPADVYAAGEAAAYDPPSALYADGEFAPDIDDGGEGIDYNPQDAHGFIRINAVRLKANRIREQQTKAASSSSSAHKKHK